MALRCVQGCSHCPCPREFSRQYSPAPALRYGAGEYPKGEGLASLSSEKVVMEFQDRPLHCIDCRQEFIFTAGEQEFYERKGFKEIPKRCKPCREQRKLRRDTTTPNGNHVAAASSNGNHAEMDA